MVAASSPSDRVEEEAQQRQGQDDERPDHQRSVRDGRRRIDRRQDVQAVCVVLHGPPNASHMIPTKATMMMTTTGARFTRKSPKSSPAAEPMRMLGGSPISVAVPPMFEAKIWLIR